MGIPFLTAFIYDYLISSINNLKQINLANECVIIDGNSFIHYIYKTIVIEDKKKEMFQRLTGTPFGYDGCWRRFHEILSLFQNKCSSITVVFDGFIKSNPYKRDDPRSNNLYIIDDEEQKQPPILLRHEFLKILRELSIEIVVARGEADPLIVRMAEEKNAYIIACDSDYHLYQLSKGYISLRFLNLETLIGPSFQLNDVFGRIGKAGVALWATVIVNTFLTFSVIQTCCPIKSIGDRKAFRQWLDKVDADANKREWITAQWSVLRFIQKSDTDTAYNQLIHHVPQHHRFQFDQIMKNYIDIQQQASLNTRSGNLIPVAVEKRFIDGELDRTLIDILINKGVPTSWQDLSSVNFNLLLPVLYILLKWNYQIGETDNSNPIVTYKEQQYDVFEIVKNKNMPVLNNIPNLPRNDQKEHVLYCIHFALEYQDNKHWNKINEEYILWLSLLKLWFHQQNNKTSVVEPILFTLIVSFLKHILLDTYNEDERNTSNEQLLAPFLQYSSDELKEQFPLKVCAVLREEIDRYSANISTKHPITSALHEVEQLYDHLAMINQFFSYPLSMPAPHKCISQLTYRLAIVFSNSKDIFKDISNIFSNDKFLVDITQEIWTFINKHFY